MTDIEIDNESGFCFGVVTAIRKAEEELAAGGSIYCLGDIVHNSREVERLEAKGLKTITHDDLCRLENVKVLLRAHGEPPSTYRTAASRGIEVIDATCPVVLRLQRRINELYHAYEGAARPQIVIYGKLGHAEVNGLVGQTEGNAIVVEDIDGLSQIDFTRPVALYSQTTKSLEGFRSIIAEIERRIAPGVEFRYFDTICRRVSNRVNKLREFARKKDVVLFVAGAKSSNGRILFNHCSEVNSHTYLVGDEKDLKREWFDGAETVGICGATSTPRWLMEQVRDALSDMLK